MVNAMKWKASAVKEVPRLARKIIMRVLRTVEPLADDPRLHGSVKLAGSEHTDRVRIGENRVVYDVLDAEVVVEVVRIGHRRDVNR